MGKTVRCEKWFKESLREVQRAVMHVPLQFVAIGLMGHKAKEDRPEAPPFRESDGAKVGNVGNAPVHVIHRRYRRRRHHPKTVTGTTQNGFQN